MTRNQSDNTACLKAERVAFTGRLATMTWAEATELVARLGGTVDRRLTRDTTLLVVGQGSLPLDGDGLLSPRLRRARRQFDSLRVMNEEQWLEHLDRDEAGLRRLLGFVDLVRMLAVRPRRLHTWIRWGLLKPIRSEHGVFRFDFMQASAAKKLVELTEQGVSLARIRKSLRQLGRWWGDVDSPLAQLAILEKNGHLLVRCPTGQLADTGGQMHLEFPDEHPPSVQLASQPRTAEAWFEHGCRQEDRGEMTEALASYRQALLLGGPTAEGCFNLANVLYSLGQKAQASERYRQAVELDAGFVEAWNNLGIVLAELKQCDEALWAYRRAIELDPKYADTHFNLAECLEVNGCVDDAAAHWAAYLRLDPASEWGAYAQSRIVSKGGAAPAARPATPR